MTEVSRVLQRVLPGEHAFCLLPRGHQMESSGTRFSQTLRVPCSERATPSSASLPFAWGPSPGPGWLGVRGPAGRSG